MRRIEFEGRDGRRRLVAAMRGGRIRHTRATAIAASITGILALLLHGGVHGGFLKPEGAGPSADGRRTAATSGLQREVDPMRSQLVVGVAALVAAAASAHGVDRLVPEQYPTIQAAHDAAADGDRIVLAPGTYPMQDWAISKAVTVTSADGCLSTTVRADLPGAVSRAFSIAGPTMKSSVRVVGITFVGGGAAAVTAGNVAIERCRFVAAVQGALGLSGNSRVRLERCSFEQCAAASAGAIGAWSTQLTAIDCVFRNNTANWSGGPSEGGAIHMLASPGTFDRCIFVGNTAAIGGAICRWWNNPSVQVSNSRFGANSSDWNCCVQCSGCGSASQSEFEADCNSNGVPDRIEILVHPSADLNGDSIPDACQCSADIVRDGAVNGADLAIVLVAWGTSGAQYPGVDIDGNEVVNGSDLGAVLAAWGPCPE